MNNWISVKDILPEKYNDVLVWDGDLMDVCYLSEDGNFYITFNEGKLMILVTHWRFLPLPPVEDK